MATFTELVQAVQKHPKMFTVGTITGVDEGTMSCTIKPEDGGEVVDKVPIRVMRHGNQIGFSVVPKVGTEVIVMWLDEYRPTIFQVHEWDKVIVKDKSDVGMVVKGDEIWVGEIDFGLKIKTKTGPITVGKTGCGRTVTAPAGSVTLQATAGTITRPGPGGTLSIAASGTDQSIEAGISDIKIGSNDFRITVPLKGEPITLGSGPPYEGVVKCNELDEYVRDKIIDIYNSHKHTAPGGLTSGPSVPMDDSSAADQYGSEEVEVS